MSEPKPTARDALLEQWKTVMEIYRHHWDLFLKAVVLYFAILGGLAGFLFRESTAPAAQRGLSLLAAALSVITFIGCLMARAYVRRLQSFSDDLAQLLEMPKFPLSGALAVTGLFACGSLFFVIAAVAYAIAALP
jgi:hypothetical protein